MNKVSVIIPTYNCVRFLSESIQSALSQTYQDFEIIIIDDGSKDNTREIVEGFIQRNPGKIRYIYQENGGLAVARNTGIKNSNGKYIALLDSDDTWLPNRLSAQIPIMESDSKIGLVHANITRINEEGQPVRTPSRDREFLLGDIFEYIFLRKTDIACPTVLFRRECCDKVGLFDEYLTRLGCEDRELWLRITQHYKVGYVDEVLAHYRILNNSMSKNLEKMITARCYVVDKISKGNRIASRLRIQALARVYRDAGDVLLSGHDFDDARRKYMKSLGYAPFSRWTYINLIKAILRMPIKLNVYY